MDEETTALNTRSGEPSDKVGDDWRRPPVIEVVVGVQFDPLPGLTNAHLAEIWQSVLRDRYPRVADAPVVEDPPDMFLDAESIRVPRLSFGAVSGASRLRAMTRPDDDIDAKMIQLQNGWVVANWMHTKQRPYPGFRGVATDLTNALNAVRDYLRANDMGPLMPRMWEVAYVDHIPAGPLWQTDAELPSVFPGLLGHGRAEGSTSQIGEAVWRWRFDRPRRANLRVTLTVHRGIGNPPVRTAVVESLARGPIKPDDPDGIEAGVACGREIAVRTFTGLCSDRALAYWKGQD